MISYKTPQADLESKKGLFFEIGMVVTLIIVYAAFQLQTPNRARDTVLNPMGMTDIEEHIIQTRQPETPPPPQQNPVQQITMLTVVDNTEDTPELDIQADIDQNTVLPEYVPVERSKPEEITEPDIFLVVEQQPSFPGGEAARLKYFGENIKYPQEAREMNIQGTVYVGFVVEPDGSISNVRILRGIGAGCDEEAMRIVSGMPVWNPGKQRGRAVRVQFNLGVRFTLI
jgi:periplasmic protein TonB